MSQLTLYLFVGYPGAGKTTTAKVIQAATDAEYIWVDDEWRKMFGITPVHSEANSVQLYTYLNAKAEQLLAAGKSVIYDTNFNFRADRDLMRQIAAKHGAATVLIWLTTPQAVARQRSVEATPQSANRALGVIEPAEFKRISDRLEPPADDEHPVALDGTDLTEDQIKQALQLA